MDRRGFITAAAVTAGSAFLGNKAFAFSEENLDSDLIVSEPKVLKAMRDVLKTTTDCVAAGNLCIQHCQEEMIKGHGKEFKNCSLAAHQMVPVCEMIGRLAAFKAKSIADFLDGCIKACDACFNACKEHEAHFGHGMHLECKRCMEACAACREACRQLRAML